MRTRELARNSAQSDTEGNTDMSFYNSKKVIHCPDTGETVTRENYLRSKHWKSLREKVYEYYEGKCQRCGDYIPLSVANIHHRVYKRLGNENLSDLNLYCKHCHSCIHSKRKENHIVNGDLQMLIFKFLTPDERQEAFDVLVKHFNLDIDLIEKKKEETVKKGIEKHLRKKIREAQRENRK